MGNEVRAEAGERLREGPTVVLAQPDAVRGGRQDVGRGTSLPVNPAHGVVPTDQTRKWVTSLRRPWSASVRRRRPAEIAVPVATSRPSSLRDGRRHRTRPCPPNRPCRAMTSVLRCCSTSTHLLGASHPDGRVEWMNDDAVHPACPAHGGNALRRGLCHRGSTGEPSLARPFFSRFEPDRIRTERGVAGVISAVKGPPFSKMPPAHERVDALSRSGRLSVRCCRRSLAPPNPPRRGRPTNGPEPADHRRPRRSARRQSPRLDAPIWAYRTR